MTRFKLNGKAEYRRPQTCDKCRGKGKIIECSYPKDKYINCWDCNGTGKIWRYQAGEV